MSKGFQWEKARQSDALKKYPSAARVEKGKKRAHLRQQALQRFAREHGLACFVCDGTGPTVEWAKTGVSARGPWALCAPCAANKRQAARPAEPTAEA